jgi:hypothetical protein
LEREEVAIAGGSSKRRGEMVAVADSGTSCSGNAGWFVARTWTMWW